MMCMQHVYIIQYSATISTAWHVNILLVRFHVATVHGNSLHVRAAVLPAAHWIRWWCSPVSSHVASPNFKYIYMYSARNRKLLIETF